MPYTPNSIAPVLNELDAQEEQIDVAISSCNKLDPPTLAAQWMAFRDRYLKFSAASKKYLASTYQMLANPIDYALTMNQIGSTTDNYRTEMNQWATIANQQCGGHVGSSIDRSPGPTDVISSVTWLLGIATVGYLVINLVPFKPFARGRR